MFGMTWLCCWFPKFSDIAEQQDIHEVTIMCYTCFMMNPYKEIKRRIKRIEEAPMFLVI